MNKETTKKFVKNNGFVCKNCEKIVIDGKKHKNEEDLCDECCEKEMQRLKTELSAKVEYIHELLEVKEDYKKQLLEIKNDYSLLEEQLENTNAWNKELLQEIEYYKQDDNIYAKNMSRLANRHNKDKISFAVEKLEKVKELCKEKFDWWENSEWEGNIYDKTDVSNAYFDIEAHIEEQIKQLKEGK